MLRTDEMYTHRYRQRTTGDGGLYSYCSVWFDVCVGNVTLSVTYSSGGSLIRTVLLVVTLFPGGSVEFCE